MFQEIAEQPVASRRQDALGVELEPELERVPVADRHDHSIQARMDLEAAGDVAGAKAVIAPDAHRAWHSFEKPGAVMVDQRRLAMDDCARRSDRPAGLLHQGLVTKTYAKQGDPALREPDGLAERASLGWTPGTR